MPNDRKGHGRIVQRLIRILLIVWAVEVLVVLVLMLRAVREAGREKARPS
jgi:hypothetical protein